MSSKRNQKNLHSKFKMIVMSVPAGPWLRAAKIWSHFGGTPQLEAQLQKGTWCELC